MRQIRFIRISFFLCVLFAIVAFWAGFYYGNTQNLSNNQIAGSIAKENVTDVADSTIPRTQAGITASEETVESMQTLSPEVYYLKCKNEYVVVYKGTSAEVYFETGLKINDLPDALQRQVRIGMKFDSLPELYSFLENYSS